METNEFYIPERLYTTKRPGEWNKLEAYFLFVCVARFPGGNGFIIFHIAAGVATPVPHPVTVLQERRWLYSVLHITGRKEFLWENITFFYKVLILTVLMIRFYLTAFQPLEQKIILTEKLMVPQFTKKNPPML
jgi:hypothetical protein